MSEARCEWHMDNWAQWMSGGYRQLTYWYPSRASGRIGKSNSTDFDTMVHNADVRCAVAVDVLIDDLPRLQRESIYHVKLAAAWTYLYPVEVVYSAATRSVAVQLSKRGIM